MGGPFLRESADRVTPTLEPIRLIISHHPNGSLSVEGPIENKEYCLALLENAKDAVRNHHTKKALIVPPGDIQL